MNKSLPEVVMPNCSTNRLLTGQKALVTGANSDIGKAVAIALGHAGADVVVTDGANPVGTFSLATFNSIAVQTGAGDDIVTAHVKTSGPGGDGIQIYSFDPAVSGYIKIKATETGGADTITVSAWLVMA